jgi:hypothetical protein
MILECDDASSSLPFFLHLKPFAKGIESLSRNLEMHCNDWGTSSTRIAFSTGCRYNMGRIPPKEEGLLQVCDQTHAEMLRFVLSGAFLSEEEEEERRSLLPVLLRKFSLHRDYINDCWQKDECTVLVVFAKDRLVIASEQVETTKADYFKFGAKIQVDSLPYKQEELGSLDHIILNRMMMYKHIRVWDDTTRDPMTCLMQKQGSSKEELLLTLRPRRWLVMNAFAAVFLVHFGLDVLSMIATYLAECDEGEEKTDDDDGHGMIMDTVRFFCMEKELAQLYLSRENGRIARVFEPVHEERIVQEASLTSIRPSFHFF